LANLNSTHFDNLIIPNPPLSEQTRISSYLDTKTSLIDKAIKEVKTENTLLKEYRQSLISNIVTGKIDVRNN
jgi:restriction endonuclease S subunit